MCPSLSRISATSATLGGRGGGKSYVLKRCDVGTLACHWFALLSTLWVQETCDSGWRNGVLVFKHRPRYKVYPGQWQDSQLFSLAARSSFDPALPILGGPCGGVYKELSPPISLPLLPLTNTHQTVLSFTIGISANQRPNEPRTREIKRRDQISQPTNLFERKLFSLTKTTTSPP